MNQLAMARFGRFFDDLLARNNLTAEGAARQLHVGQSQTSRWQRGEGGLSYSSLHRISEVFGVDLDYLLELTELDPLPIAQFRSLLNRQRGFTE